MNAEKCNSIYYYIGNTHWISEVLEAGKYVKLEDQSLWKISHLDEIYTALWHPPEEIKVLESHNPDFPYKLINTKIKESAEAQFVRT